MCQQGGWLKCLKQRENMQAAARQINFRLRKFNHVTDAIFRAADGPEDCAILNRNHAGRHLLLRSEDEQRSDAPPRRRSIIVEPGLKKESAKRCHVCVLSNNNATWIGQLKAFS